MVDKRTTPSSSPLLLKYLRAYEQNRRGRVFAPLAETYRKLGMLDKALEVCREGIKHNPGYVLGHLALAHCYFDLGQTLLSYEGLHPFVKENRDNVILQRLYAKAAKITGHNQEALDTYKYLLFVNPRDNEAAEEVAKLEGSLNPIVNSQQFENHSTQVDRFAVESMQLFNDPAHDTSVDDWALLNLQKMNPPPAKQVDSSKDWNMAPISKLEIEPTFEFPKKEVDRTFVVEFREQDSQEEISLEEDLTAKSTPLITHTLVDLYCAQGLNEKAVEILEKLLELDPLDQRTKDRLNELRQVMKGPNSKDEGREELMGLFDKAIKDNSGPRRERLIKFLDMIKKRSLEVSEDLELNS